MYFLIRVISASIIGVGAGIWVSRRARFVPPRLKPKYNFLLQAIFTVVFSIILTLLALAGVYLFWVILIALSFLTWLFSAWLTGAIAVRKGEGLERDDAPPSAV